jgi:hypothetical protein
MGWEKRGKTNQEYYYRNVKQPDGTWKKTYFGKGLRAEVESLINEKELAQKKKPKKISKQVAKAKAAYKLQQKSTVDLVNLMMAADGYHNPASRGWRKISKTKSKKGANPMDDKQPNAKTHDPLDIQQCIERAKNGDESALPFLKQHIQKNPQLVFQNADLARRTHHGWIQLLTQKDLYLKICLQNEICHLKSQLMKQGNGTVVEKLIIDQVISTYLQIYYHERVNMTRLSFCSEVPASETKALEATFNRHMRSLCTYSAINAISAKAQIEKAINSALENATAAS